jgi:hypothetical protein|nr:MAG TPA: hypothetical protein [Caudoviricetes sp.]
MWITPDTVAIPTIPHPQPPVGNSGGAVDHWYAQPLIHRLSTTDPQGYPQGYPHDPAHRVGLKTRPGKTRTPGIHNPDTHHPDTPHPDRNHSPPPCTP